MFGKRSFTLIEVLVVGTVVAVMSVLGLAAYNQISISSRDARRINDLDSLRNGLEVYRSSNGFYPQTLDNLLSANILTSLPRDPKTQIIYTYNKLPSNCDNEDIICSSYNLTSVSEKLADAQYLASTYSIVLTTPTPIPASATATPTPITFLPTNTSTPTPPAGATNTPTPTRTPTPIPTNTPTPTRTPTPTPTRTPTPLPPTNTPTPSQQTITVSITNSNDDAWQDADANKAVHTSENYIKLGWYMNRAGFRFNNAQFSNLAQKTIISASLSFTSIQTTSVALSMRVYGQKNINCSSFSAAYDNLGARTLTTNYQSWSISSGWANATGYSTPNITSVIQEIVNQASYQGGAICIFINNFSSGNYTERQIASYEHTYTEPRLTVTYYQ